MKPSLLVSYQDDRWTLVRQDGEQSDLREVPAGPEEAAVLKAIVAEWGCGGQGVCLGLDSQMVFSAPIDCTSLPRKDRRSAMLYRLEEQLPMEIEKLTADFLPPAGGQALGVAVQTARVRELIERLGAETAAVAPTALLALWDACQGRPPCDYALVVCEDTIDIFRMRDGQPTAWYTVVGTGPELARCIQADLLASPVAGPQPTACVVAEGDWTTAALEEDLGLAILHRQQESPLTAAARTAAQILAGEEAGWTNLRRDALSAGGPWGLSAALLRGAAILGMVLLAALTAAFVVRGLRYARAADEAISQQGRTYAALHPQAPHAGAVRKRLQSELSRLEALSGMASEVPRQINALETLRRLTAALPPDVVLRVMDLTLSPDLVLLIGQSRTHGDAEMIGRALAQSGFQMDPPRTDLLSPRGVGFTLTGKPPAEPPPAAKEHPTP